MATATATTATTTSKNMMELRLTDEQRHTLRTAFKFGPDAVVCPLCDAPMATGAGLLKDGCLPPAKEDGSATDATYATNATGFPFAEQEAEGGRINGADEAR